VQLDGFAGGGIGQGQVTTEAELLDRHLGRGARERGHLHAEPAAGVAVEHVVGVVGDGDDQLKGHALRLGRSLGGHEGAETAGDTGIDAVAGTGWI
jgi:hypothetical protein